MSVSAFQITARSLLGAEEFAPNWINRMLWRGIRQELPLRWTMGGFDVSYCQDLDGGRRSVEPSVSEGEHFVGSGPFRKALHKSVCKAVGLSGELDLLVRHGAGSVEPNWSDRQPTVAAAARALNANGIGSVSLSRQAPIHVALILKRSHGCAVLPENHLFFAWRPMSIEITSPRKEPKWVF